MSYPTLYLLNYWYLTVSYSLQEVSQMKWKYDSRFSKELFVRIYSFIRKTSKTLDNLKMHLLTFQVRHLYICDFHKNFIQSVRNKRKRKTSDDGGESPDHDVEVPEVSGVKNQSTAARHLTCAVVALLLNVASFQHEHTTVTDPGFDSVHLCGVPCSYHDAYYWK
ncbi:hypothetical protein ILYODFUR_037121 [Ilyodon furcidens]|uniref:Histone deacetylase complex subunit SAP30 zinc-finger domain-containing protein n=1 Tax=Ilyodon furcidens TaxID=33524 RepID=A0ABV0SS95_9TELE